MSILTALEILPLIGALIVGFAPKGNSKLIKQIALGTTLLVAIVSLLAFAKFDKNVSSFQFVESRTWVSAFNINYSVGVS